MIIALYCIISFWSFGEIKSNPVKFLWGSYENKTIYLLEDIVENNLLENAVVLDNNNIYAEDADSIIRIHESYSIKSIVINVLDFENPEGTDALALTTHVYYRNKQNEEKSKILLTRIGDNIFNLDDCKSKECIISLSNIPQSSILIQSIEVCNYKQKYQYIFWGLTLCIILCTMGINYCKTEREKYNKHSDLIYKMRKYTFLVSFCFTIILIGIYVYYYFLWPHIIHPEAYSDFAQYANKDRGLFLKNLIPKVFDCTMIEHGLYRSRALAFLWQYIDTNLMIVLDRLIPGFGIKMPLTLLIIPASILVWGYVFRKNFTDVSWVWGILFGAVMLFIPNIQTATYLFLRSAKILVPVLGLGIINYGINHLEEDMTIKQYAQIWKENILCILLLFILCTFDEQVIAVCVFLFGISILSMLYRKRIQRLSINMLAVLVMYIVYDKWWGRWLFEYFTPVKLQKHVHNISMVITDFDFIYVRQSLEIYVKILRETFINDIILGAVFGVFIGLWFCIDNWKEKLIAISLLLLSYGLTLVILIGLPILYYYDDMILSIYFISSILIFIYAMIYVLSKSKILENTKHSTGFIKREIVVFALMLLLFVNIRNIEQCHLRHLGINGGSVQFRDELYDLSYFDKYYDSVIVTRQQYDNYIEK
ncbi:MAG: hypothetical protein NC341_04800 [Blautia sp.]|nr:hypothetical protein [Blautia sp.]